MAVVFWAVRSGLLRRLAAGARCGEADPQLGDDADHPAYTFIEPSVGYRMGQGQEASQAAEPLDGGSGSALQHVLFVVGRTCQMVECQV